MKINYFFIQILARKKKIKTNNIVYAAKNLKNEEKFICCTFSLVDTLIEFTIICASLNSSAQTFTRQSRYAYFNTEISCNILLA